MVKSVGRVKICITRLQMHCLLQCYLIKIIFFLLKHIPFQRWHSRPQMQCCQYFPAQWGKSFILSFIARDPVHLFLFAQWIRPTHIFCWFPPTLFFSNICLAELGPSFTAEDLWNICEISMKYLWNICEILVIYLWNFTIFSNMCTTEVALSSSTENCTAKNWLVYCVVSSYMYLSVAYETMKI